MRILSLLIVTDVYPINNYLAIDNNLDKLAEEQKILESQISSPRRSVSAARW